MARPNIAANRDPMKCLDLTFPTPAENLACDEALLERCEASGGEEILRFWEPTRYFVVVGYGNRVAVEVDLPACAAHGVPVLRRCSGGGTVLQGPGCLNYALVLRAEESGPLGTITGANRFIMDHHRDALAAALGHPIHVQGHTDLTLGGLKFSGNAQRRKRAFLLFHGCFLLQFDLALVARCLPMPSQQPGYRQGRPHADFLTNLRLTADAVKSVLRRAWDAATSLEEPPFETVTRLAQSQYAARGWNFKF